MLKKAPQEDLLLIFCFMLFLSNTTLELVALMTLQGPGVSNTHHFYSCFIHFDDTKGEPELFKSHAEGTKVSKYCGGQKKNNILIKERNIFGDSVLRRRFSCIHQKYK